ncbi:protein INCA1 isoform X14 [Ahaetulla prasina]|uniref:protein INCA1 isoform X14 n=1 Tax=Ahaetulla prasina TaxID=499056 RepID=UPI00264A0AAA|nr:protein INCA1 isoform X14 [Ahaetulla prasina]
MEMMNSIIFSASKDITWQSKMVSRDQPEVDPSSDTHCTADFWDRLVQQPRCPAVQPSGLKEKRGGLGPGRRLLLRKGSRPPRSCVRRRGRVRSRRASDTSVACPSCIIWRRQKAAQEGGALPQLSPQRNGMVRDLPACLLSPARTPEPYARPFLGRGTGAQLLLHPQWNPNLREPRRFSEESPLAFYAVAAHHRSLHAGSTELLRPEE